MKKTYCVYAERVAIRCFEVEAESEEDAIKKVRDELIDSVQFTEDDFISGVNYWV